MVEGEHTADTIAANNTPAQRDNDELFAKALELAPRFDTLANVARAVNDAFDIDTTAAAWRGLLNRNPEQKERIRRAGRFTTRTANRWIYNQESPCLCRLDPEYADDPDWVDWVQGVTLFEIKGRNLRIDAVEFFPDYTCMVGKQHFSL